MAETSDILWGMYQEQCTQSRHHESQRATMTNLFIAVSAGLISLVTYDKAIDVTDLPLTIFLIPLGCFGALFSAKHYERARLHVDRGREYRAKLEEILPGTELSELMGRANKHHNAEFPKVHNWHLNWFWICLHLMIALLGVILSIVAVAHHGSS